MRGSVGEYDHLVRAFSAFVLPVAGLADGTVDGLTLLLLGDALVEGRDVGATLRLKDLDFCR